MNKEVKIINKIKPRNKINNNKLNKMPNWELSVQQNYSLFGPLKVTLNKMR